MPNRPGPSASSTSSEVDPESASSKSWITPAPFIASAETKPRSIRSIRTGDSPVLSTCAPMPQRRPRSAARAARMAATTALKSAPASIDGSDSTNAATVAAAPAGFAKSAAFALLRRDASGYVRTPARSNSSYSNVTPRSVARNAGAR